MGTEFLAFASNGETMLLETKEGMSPHTGLEKLIGGAIEALVLPTEEFCGKQITLFFDGDRGDWRANLFGTALARLAFRAAGDTRREEEIMLHGVVVAAHEYITDGGDSVFEVIPDELLKVVQQLAESMLKASDKLEDKLKSLKEIAESN